MKEQNDVSNQTDNSKSDRMDKRTSERRMDGVSSRNDISSNADSRNNYTKAADIVQGWANSLNKYHQGIEEKYTDEYIERSTKETSERVGNAILKAGEAFARFGESIKPFK